MFKFLCQKCEFKISFTSFLLHFHSLTTMQVFLTNREGSLMLMRHDIQGVRVKLRRGERERDAKTDKIEKFKGILTEKKREI